MMPKLEEDKRQKNLEKNIKKEWLEDFEQIVFNLLSEIRDLVLQGLFYFKKVEIIPFQKLIHLERNF